ncbi:hypothetical protein GQX73_g5859 [Xylaria multiplex]|uniref:Acyl-CoA dehydrogenase/oxidase C-terminal domain-containing protein n=1 Tax=Xylaria multiplex TaxID=323545 RepID=A0A7C8MNV2_9PEZI|nr:hypothetical protein GQX73_g5859 [Xylaria multiplex]
MDRQKPYRPSSSTEGFFQAVPTVPPAYSHGHESKDGGHGNVSDDVALARVLKLYLPQGNFEVRQSIHNLARRALHPSVLRHGVDAELNPPTLRPLTTFGEENRVDPLWVTEGWKALKAIGQEEGLVSAGYDTTARWNRRIHQSALNHVWNSSAALTGCPAAMTDGAAKLLQSHLDDLDGDQPGRAAVIRQVYNRLVSRDPGIAWTSGQWMTERTGGSDVRESETLARRLASTEIAHCASVGQDCDAHGMPLGPWCIDGFKWFSSATDSDMALLLAQTESGLSLFYIPMRRHARSGMANVNELNGIHIQRLKTKLGTKQLPTAELELKGVRGWLIGQEGRGVKQIATILNITRLYTAGGSAAAWGRGLSVCRAYTKARRVHRTLLQNNQLHVRWLANETVKYHAAVHFTFFGLALQGATEQGWILAVRGTKAASLIPQDSTIAVILLRLITPVIKAVVSVNAAEGLRACMEGLGGVGYCENNEDGGILNIARIFRDALANPIWEGTVSVMAEDVVRVLVDRRLADGRVIEKVLAKWAHGVLRHCEPRFSKECSLIEQRLNTLLSMTNGANENELLWRGRELLFHLEAIVSSLVLMYDACSDENEIATAIALRYVHSRALAQLESFSNTGNWKEVALMDRKIFLAESGDEIVGKL